MDDLFEEELFFKCGLGISKHEVKQLSKADILHGSSVLLVTTRPAYTIKGIPNKTSLLMVSFIRKQIDAHLNFLSSKAVH